LQAKPSWTPLQVRQALMMTASRHSNPDNNYGWGIIDVWAAIHYNQSAAEDERIRIEKDREFGLASLPNPTSGATTLSFTIGRAGEVSLGVYDASGRLVRDLLSGPRSPGRYAVRWDGKDASGARVAIGVYFFKLSTQERTQSGKIVVLR
jgi:hypothetical protein